MYRALDSQRKQVHSAALWDMLLCLMMMRSPSSGGESASFVTFVDEFVWGEERLAA
jgi:hypothetical protein